MKKEKKYKLEVTWIPTYEGAVLNAIKEAKIQNKIITKIGLPIKVQRDIMKSTTPMKKGMKLECIFGIKVEQSKVMTITTQFSQFNRK